MNIPLEFSYSFSKKPAYLASSKISFGGLSRTKWCISVTQNLNLNEVWIHLDKELSAPLQAAAILGWAPWPFPVCRTKHSVFAISPGQLAIDLAYLPNSLPARLGHTYTWTGLIPYTKLASSPWEGQVDKSRANPQLWRGGLKQRHLENSNTLRI